MSQSMLKHWAAASFLATASLLHAPSAEGQFLSFVPTAEDIEASSLNSDIQTATADVANSIRQTSAPYPNRPEDQAALKRDTFALQILLEKYRQKNNDVLMPPAAGMDGKFGRKTAELLIEVATREFMTEMFIYRPDLDDTTSYTFLRNKLKELAPDAYTTGLGVVAEAYQQDVEGIGLTVCLNNAPKGIFPDRYLQEQLDKIHTDPLYVSPVFPSECTDALKTLKIATRIKAQVEYIEQILRPDTNSDMLQGYCARKEQSGTVGMSNRCIEYKL